MSEPLDEGSSRLGDLRHRVRYRFDNLLARGTWVALLWLGVVTLAVVLLSAVLLVAFGVTLSGSASGSWLEDFWQSLLRVLDTGTMAADVGWGRRILALFVTLAGVLFAGTLIGIIAAGVEDRIDEMRHGRSVVIERGHIVVLGSSDRLPVLVGQLVLANAGRPDGVIVAMSEDDPVDVRRAVDRTVPDKQGMKIVYRSGDPTLVADLEIVRLETARAVIVLTDATEEATAVKTVLAVGDRLGEGHEIRVVVDVLDPGTAERLVHACGDWVHPIVARQAVTRSAGFALRQRGLGGVIAELFDVRGSDLLVLDRPDAAGRPFGALALGSANARMIGMIGPGGTVRMAPPPDTLVGPDDRLVAIGDAPDALVPSTRPAPALPTGPVERLAMAAAEEHLLVLGWNETAAELLTSWATAAPPACTVEVRYDPDVVDGVPDPPTLGVADVTLIADPDPGPMLTTDAGRPITTIVILAGTALSEREADARTLLTIRTAQRAHGARQDAPRIVAQLRDVDSAELANLTGPDDELIGDALGSQFIAQLVDEPRRRSILLSLYREDVSLHLVRAATLGIAGLPTAGDLYEAAYQRGAIAIGWRSAAERGSVLTMNPHEDAPSKLDDDDLVVIIG